MAAQSVSVLSGSVFGNGKEISYTRAIASAAPFLGLFAIIGNFLRWNNGFEIDRRYKDAGIEIQKTAFLRAMRVTSAYMKLAIVSGVGTIVILVALAATGKMKVQLVALSVIPCITIALGAKGWHWSKELYAIEEKKGSSKKVE